MPPLAEEADLAAPAPAPAPACLDDYEALAVIAAYCAALAVCGAAAGAAVALLAGATGAGRGEPSPWILVAFNATFVGSIACAFAGLALRAYVRAGIRRRAALYDPGPPGGCPRTDWARSSGRHF